MFSEYDMIFSELGILFPTIRKNCRQNLIEQVQTSTNQALLVEKCSYLRRKSHKGNRNEHVVFSKSLVLNYP